jgi:hypothetical protein
MFWILEQLFEWTQKASKKMPQITLETGELHIFSSPASISNVPFFVNNRFETNLKNLFCRKINLLIFC